MSMPIPVKRDDYTDSFDLPLPHPENSARLDANRIRESLIALDQLLTPLFKEFLVSQGPYDTTATRILHPGDAFGWGSTEAAKVDGVDLDSSSLPTAVYSLTSWKGTHPLKEDKSHSERADLFIYNGQDTFGTLQVLVLYIEGIPCRFARLVSGSTLGAWSREVQWGSLVEAIKDQKNLVLPTNTTTDTPSARDKSKKVATTEFVQQELKDSVIWRSVTEPAFQLEANKSYFLKTNGTTTLPANPVVGTYVRLTKAYGFTPSVKGSGSNLINVRGQIDAQLTFNAQVEITLVWSGTHWEA